MTTIGIHGAQNLPISMVSKSGLMVGVASVSTFIIEAPNYLSSSECVYRDPTTLTK